MPPTVSVVVPIYNMEDYLERCVCSILGQSYRHLDIILVDDGSTDHSARMCHQFARQDKRIAYLWQTNAGLGAARNAGIQAATAEYITFLDADDWFEPAFIEKVLRAMQTYESEIGLCDIYYVESESLAKAAVKIRFDGPVASCQDDKSIVNKSRLFAWGKIFRLELLERMHFSFPDITYEDICIPLLIANANKIAHVAEPLINYLRHRPGSLSNTEKNIANIGKGLHLLYEELHERGMYADYALEFKKIAMGQLRFACRKWGHATEALEGDVYGLIPELGGLSQQLFHTDNGALVATALEKALPHANQVVSDGCGADYTINLTDDELDRLLRADDPESSVYNIAELLMEKIATSLS